MTDDDQQPRSESPLTSLRRPLAWSAAMTWGQRGLTSIFTFGVPIGYTLATVVGAPNAPDPSPFGYTKSLTVFIVPVAALAIWSALHPKSKVDRKALFMTGGALPTTSQSTARGFDFVEKAGKAVRIAGAPIRASERASRRRAWGHHVELEVPRALTPTRSISKPQTWMRPRRIPPPDDDDDPFG